METTQDTPWFHYPPIVLPSPVLAISAQRQGVWAGGAGGVAWYPIHSDWEPRITGLHLSAVAALASYKNILLAGGNGGIAFSDNNGLNWQVAQMPEGDPVVTALILSPHYTVDKTALAATLDSGIMSSDDGGKTWHKTSVGLQNFDISCLLWTSDEIVLAGTLDGLYHSSNSGNTWQLAEGTKGSSVAALAYLPDGSLLAALENGGLLSSQNTGLNWTEYGSLPDNVQGTALLVTTESTLLLGTAEHGILRSTDKGLTWQSVHDETAFSFSLHAQTLYAGTMNELAASVDDGETWIALPHPPIHDLRQLFIDQDQPLLVGTYAGLLHYNQARQSWVPLAATPRPLLAATLIAPSTYLISTQDGLERSKDGGTTWQNVLPGPEGQLTRLTFLPDGSGWAGSADGTRLFKTLNLGLHWEAVTSPFNAIPLAALQALPGQLIAATYDSNLCQARFWRTFDRGQHWQQGQDIEVTWPIISTWHDPALMTLGSFILMLDPHNQWQQIIVGNGMEAVRRVIGNSQVLFSLTTENLLRSYDSGLTWLKEENAPSAWQILDLAIHNQTLYLLLIGGHLWSKPF